MYRVLASLLVGLSAISANTIAQSSEGTAIEEARQLFYMIYDSSNSMWGQLSDKSRKYEAGRAALSSVLNLKLDDRDLAFRAYGHRDKTDCQDSQLIVAAGPASAVKPDIQNAVANIRPTGKTPITYSLREALKDIGDRSGDILLISDGVETCDIDPCELMEEWRNEGVKIRVHVVGVGLNEIERGAMACVAETGGGKYFDAGSEEELVQAIGSATEIEPGEPEPVQQIQGYGLNIKGTDETGRNFIIIGKLFKDDIEVMDLTSNGQQWLDEPGEYTMTVGVLLADGSIYKPVTQDVSIKERGITRAKVLVTRPAIVSASFSEDGEQHRGAFVTAYQNNEKMFGINIGDERLARPGAYEFRAKPNKDNELSVEAALTEGEHTVVDFNLVQTVQIWIEYILPGGERTRRTGQLYKDGEHVYDVFSGNYTTVKPGTYELREKSADPLNPFIPREITVTADEKQDIEVSVTSGYFILAYDGAERDFNSKANRGFVAPFDEEAGQYKATKYTRTGKSVPAKPGQYKVDAASSICYCDPVEFMVEHGKTTTVTLTAKPTAHISMTYAHGDYDREPDRAFLQPLDGQKPIKTYMSPGKLLKVPPGRYSIKPHGVPGMSTLEFTLSPGETKAVVLKE